MPLPRFGYCEKDCRTHARRAGLPGIINDSVARFHVGRFQIDGHEESATKRQGQQRQWLPDGQRDRPEIELVVVAAMSRPVGDSVQLGVSRQHRAFRLVQQLEHYLMEIAASDV